MPERSPPRRYSPKGYLLWLHGLSWFLPYYPKNFMTTLPSSLLISGANSPPNLLAFLLVYPSSPLPLKSRLAPPCSSMDGSSASTSELCMEASNHGWINFYRLSFIIYVSWLGRSCLRSPHIGRRTAQIRPAATVVDEEEMESVAKPNDASFWA